MALKGAARHHPVQRWLIGCQTPCRAAAHGSRGAAACRHPFRSASESRGLTQRADGRSCCQLAAGSSATASVASDLHPLGGRSERGGTEDLSAENIMARMRNHSMLEIPAGSDVLALAVPPPPILPAF